MVVVMPPMTVIGRRKRTKNYARFDAELDETVCDRYNNANLTITLKLGFRQINPAGGAETGTYRDYGRATTPQRRIRKWTPGSWSLWKQNFVSTAQSYWNGKFWLVNNFPTLEFEDREVVYRHNIFCRFRLTAADATAGSVHHHVIDVVRLAADEPWFGSHERLYDNRDIDPTEKGRDSANRAIMQRAHVHEVGHLLGLGHAVEGSSACPVTSDTNAAACYGSSDHDMNNVMGKGMRLLPEHAYPWRKAAADITGKGTVRSPATNRQWQEAANLVGALLDTTPVDVTSKDWTAKMERHYPRTAAEVAANAAVTRRPQR